jgi:hypothetical protein
LTHSPVLCGLATNPALPVELLDRFVAVADSELCLELAGRDDLTPAQVRRLVAYGGMDTVIHLVRRRLLSASDLDAPDPHVVLALLDETEAPGPWTRVLYAHPDPAMRADLAAAAHVPAEVLSDLSDDREVEVVAAVARSARLTGELAQALAGHPHLTVRRSVAGNERTPPPVLAALAAGVGSPVARWCSGCDGSAALPDWMQCAGADHETARIDLAYAVVTNPATPGEAVAGYAEHPTTYVRRALASRPDLPQHSYAMLAADPIPGVRGAVAENQAIDEQLIRALAGDDTYVRRRLAHNPAIPLDVLAQIAPSTKIGPTLLPRIAAATLDEIHTLARSPVPALRMMLAERPDLPATVVLLLAEDPDAKVLKSLAPNPRLTDEQLRAIVARHGVRVIAAVTRNQSCSPQLLHDLATHTPPAQKALRAIATHPNADAATLLQCLPDRQARSDAARHPALPSAVITRLLHDPDERVAEAAAANPSLPNRTMEYLISAEPDASHSDDRPPS